MAGRRDRLQLGYIRVILLKERDGDRILPIWVGAGEGDFIALLMEKIETVRPTSLDLAAEFLKIGGMKLEKVAVTALRENVFIGAMRVRKGRNGERDRRSPKRCDLPALQMDAPIFVAPEVWEQAAILKVGQEFQPVWNDQLPGAEIKKWNGDRIAHCRERRRRGFARAPDNSGAAAVTLPSRRCGRVPHPASMDPCRRLGRSRGGRRQSRRRSAQSP